MVPTMRPSPKTSIFAPTRCGVEPCVATIVTSAAGSPRSSASATAANTSRFTRRLYAALFVPGAEQGRLRPVDERLGDDPEAVGRGQLARIAVDIGEDDPLGHSESHARVPGERAL